MGERLDTAAGRITTTSTDGVRRAVQGAVLVLLGTTSIFSPSRSSPHAPRGRGEGTKWTPSVCVTTFQVPLAEEPAQSGNSTTALRSAQSSRWLLRREKEGGAFSSANCASLEWHASTT
ncbi:hypothetical protein MRX96_055677 [Rhipicephalus microplus]